MIELLVVVAILGVLAAIAIHNLQLARIRAAVGRAAEEQRMLAMTLETYRLDNEGYPRSVIPGVHAFNLAARFAALTSPVAYLGTPPNDVFPRRLDNGYTKHKIDQAPGGRAYVYGRADAALSRGSYKFHAGEEFIMLASAGPDKILRQIYYYPPSTTQRTANCPVCDPVIAPQAQVVIYDPSNGTISNGDIYRWTGSHSHVH